MDFKTVQVIQKIYPEIRKYLLTLIKDIFNILHIEQFSFFITPHKVLFNDQTTRK